jgi:hypothetical protein
MSPSATIMAMLFAAVRRYKKKVVAGLKGQVVN